jgi:hypothetical protein
MGRLIRITESDEQVEEWQAEHPISREKFDCWLTLRVVPREKRQQFVRETTETVWRQGVPLPEANNSAYAEKCIDYAIVSWRGVAGKNGSDLPCTPEHKLRLPDWLQASVMRMCAADELAMAIAAQHDGHLPAEQHGPFDPGGAAPPGSRATSRG